MDDTFSSFTKDLPKPGLGAPPYWPLTLVPWTPTNQPQGWHPRSFGQREMCTTASTHQRPPSADSRRRCVLLLIFSAVSFWRITLSQSICGTKTTDPLHWTVLEVEDPRWRCPTTCTLWRLWCTALPADRSGFPSSNFKFSYIKCENIILGLPYFVTLGAPLNVKKAIFLMKLWYDILLM